MCRLQFRIDTLRLSSFLIDIVDDNVDDDEEDEKKEEEKEEFVLAVRLLDVVGEEACYLSLLSLSFGLTMRKTKKILEHKKNDSQE